MSKMMALVKEKPEVGAELKKVDIPQLGDEDLLVKVEATAICGTDIHIYNWTKFAQDRCKLPLIFGHEFCGRVVKKGKAVKRFNEGDLVVADTHIPCGKCFQCTTGLMHICKDLKIIGVHVPGAFAEFSLLPEICAWKISDKVQPELGAIYEPFGIAVHALEPHKVAGRNVLITGAGPIGLFAIGVAKMSGAKTVFSSDISEERLKLARTMGADYTLNPKEVDIPNKISHLTEGFGIDIFIELSGSPKALQSGLQTIRRGGKVSTIGLFPEPVKVDMVTDVIYKEAVIYGITGRVMFDTWWNAVGIIESKSDFFRQVITDRFHLKDFKKAFELANKPSKGKIILIPH